MNTSNEFQLIWEYNLLRTFVRHVFMVTWDPYGKLNNRNLKYIHGDGKAKDEGCEPSVSCILKKAIGIMAKESNDKENAQKNIPEEYLPCMFFKGMVNYPDKNSEKTIFEKYAAANDLGKFVTELPEIRNISELDGNIDTVVDFIHLVKSNDLSPLGKYSICGHSIQAIATHFLNLIKTSGYAAKSDFKLPKSEPNTTALDTLANPNREIIKVMEYPHWRCGQATTSETPFDLSGNIIDWTDIFSDIDCEEISIYQSNQLFTLLLDTDDYFVRGVIVPMMAAYVGCDQLFESEQDRNADVHLNRLYDMVKEQIDVNDHKSVLDYMSKVKFMIPALLPEA